MDLNFNKEELIKLEHKLGVAGTFYYEKKNDSALEELRTMRHKIQASIRGSIDMDMIRVVAENSIVRAIDGIDVEFIEGSTLNNLDSFEINAVYSVINLISNKIQPVSVKEHK